eukprot:TRINITY_DN50615_c0_g1_i1.p1 TRINITY_DN50615_c0_g1~~TRINITY_DN50615_c0_g1_i1.p1  ORF type:complete len:298 (-),score=63.24 TRINITY_DN50615_c0_g1_i1:8-901(-)
MGGAAPGSFERYEAVSDTEFPAEEFQKSLTAWLAPMHLECSPPFLVEWYNSKRSEVAGGTQSIDAPDSAVAFAVYSVPHFLDVIVEQYARERPKDAFVDGTTNAILSQLRSLLPASLKAEIVNTDVGPPYYHVQTIGAIAGVDQHIEVEDLRTVEDYKEWEEDLSDQLEETRDPKMWGTSSEMRRKIFGVNVHPVYGGWYAYRALIVLGGASKASLKKPEELKFVETENARRIMHEYNMRHANCNWRDLRADGHPPERAYSPEEFFFFTETSPEKRKRFLEMKASKLPSPLPKPRWE